MLPVNLAGADSQTGVADTGKSVFVSEDAGATCKIISAVYELSD